MENKKICSLCKGMCCKKMGCHYSPQDFKEISFDLLKIEIDKGHISIDWWEGNPFDELDDSIERVYFLRVRNVKSKIIDPSWGGVCSLLTENGCSLEYKDRPKGGRELIPNEKRDCILNYNKQDCAKEWYKYDEILTQLYNLYKSDDKKRRNKS